VTITECSNIDYVEHSLLVECRKTHIKPSLSPGCEPYFHHFFSQATQEIERERERS